MWVGPLGPTFGYSKEGLQALKPQSLNALVPTFLLSELPFLKRQGKKLLLTNLLRNYPYGNIL